ncbi:MAG: Hsp20 family protein [Kiloniellaceae bacterium]
MRSAFDFSPLFRSTIGFDRLPGLLDSVTGQEDVSQGCPPYNIEKLDEESYRITMAVAGFTENDLHVQLREQALVVSGQLPEDSSDKTFLHRGIADCAFQRSFRIADHVKVTGAELKDGLLHIHLVQELPEEMKPRRIEIQSSPALKRITDGTRKAA